VWFAWRLSFSVHTPPSVTVARGESRGLHQSFPAVGKVIRIRGQASGRAVPPTENPFGDGNLAVVGRNANSRFFTDCYIWRSQPTGSTATERGSPRQGGALPAPACGMRRDLTELPGADSRLGSISDAGPSRRRCPRLQAGNARARHAGFNSPVGAERPGCPVGRLPRSYAQAPALGAPEPPMVAAREAPA